MQKTCDKILKCGHPCGGSVGEKECMPCLEEECINKLPQNMQPKKNKSEFCTICYCTELG